MEMSLPFSALWTDSEDLRVMNLTCKLSSTSSIPSLYLHLLFEFWNWLAQYCLSALHFRTKQGWNQGADTSSSHGVIKVKLQLSADSVYIILKYVSGLSHLGRENLRPQFAISVNMESEVQHRNETHIQNI